MEYFGSSVNVTLLINGWILVCIFTDDLWNGVNNGVPDLCEMGAWSFAGDRGLVM